MTTAEAAAGASDDYYFVFKVGHGFSWLFLARGRLFGVMSPQMVRDWRAVSQRGRSGLRQAWLK